MGAMGAPTGCAPAAAPKARADTDSTLRVGPLVDCVPSAGLRWLLVARLEELAKNTQIQAPLARLIPGERFDAFRRMTGVDLRELRTAIAAGFDDSTLYLAQTGARTAEATRLFDERLMGEATHVRSHPRVQRIYGVLGSVPETLVSVDGAFVAVSAGDPMPARITELMVERKIRTPSALRGVALSLLPADLASAPVYFFAPGPFSGEWAAAGRGLLGAATAVGVAAWPEGEMLRVHAAVTGRWADEDRTQLEAAWADLAASSLGHLLGLNRPLLPAVARATRTQLSLEAGVAVEPLMTGLWAAVGAGVPHLFGGSKPMQIAPPGSSEIQPLENP